MGSLGSLALKTWTMIQMLKARKMAFFLLCPTFTLLFFLSQNGGQDNSALLSLAGLYPLYGPFPVVLSSFPVAFSRDIARDTAALASLGLSCHTHSFLTANQTILAERIPALRRFVRLMSEWRTPRQKRVPQRCMCSRPRRLQRRTPRKPERLVYAIAVLHLRL